MVYSRDELMQLPPETEKVLGVFAAAHTFSDRTEEYLRDQGFPLYAPGHPPLPR